MSTDLVIHLTQVVMLAFYVGVSYSDLKWLKRENAEIRAILISNGLRMGKQLND